MRIKWIEWKAENLHKYVLNLNKFATFIFDISEYLTHNLGTSEDQMGVKSVKNYPLRQKSLWEAGKLWKFMVSIQTKSRWYLWYLFFIFSNIWLFLLVCRDHTGLKWALFNCYLTTVIWVSACFGVQQEAMAQIDQKIILTKVFLQAKLLVSSSTFSKPIKVNTLFIGILFLLILGTSH